MKTRSYEKEFIIDAPIEDVWKALAEAEEITKWFSTEAKVTPGEGGEIYLAWNEDFKGTSKIEIWDPPNHLRSVEHREAWQADEPEKFVADTPNAVPLTVDYYLSTEQGKTVLRLVHSGFGVDESWDDEFNSIQRGWGTMILNMRKYLENHRGKECLRVWKQFTLTGDAETAWNKFCSISGLPNKGIALGTSVAHPFSDDLPLAVDISLEGFELGLAVGEDNQELIRLSLFPMPEGCLAWFDYLSYGLSNADFEQRVAAWLDHYGPAFSDTGNQA